MPACAAANTRIEPASPLAATLFRLPLRIERNGSCRFHSGCRAATVFTRCSANTSCTDAGCSGHNVPSLSNTAMRSARGMKSLDSGVVTSVTKSTIERLVPVSFHDASAAAVDAPAADSLASWRGVTLQAERTTTVKATQYRCIVRIMKASSKAVGRTLSERQSNREKRLLQPLARFF